MKITLEGTEADKGKAVSIINPSDDLDIAAIADLLRALLLAWGYQPKNVDELIEAN